MKMPVYDERWAAEVKALYKHDMEQLWDPSLSPHQFIAYQNQLSIYRSLVPNHSVRILDVGCAQATLAMQLAEDGHDVTAVDLRDSFISYARSRYERGKLRFFQLNALEDEIPGRYDIVFANQIIEHLVYPVDFLRKLRTNLLPGGRIVVATPNWNYVMNRLPSYRELGNPAQWSDKQFTADADGHFYAYRAEELIDAFKGAGFVQAKALYFETPVISGHCKFRLVQHIFARKTLQWMESVILYYQTIGRILAHQLLVTASEPDAQAE